MTKLMTTENWNSKAMRGICPVPNCPVWKVSLRAITAHLAKKHNLRINWKQIAALQSAVAADEIRARGQKETA